MSKKKKLKKNNYFIIKNIIFFIQIFIIIIKNKLYFKTILFCKNLYFFIERQKEYRNIENFLKISSNVKRTKKGKNKKIKVPKISVISPLFNSQRYILRFINNIHHQSFNNIEIILIDDCSKEEIKKKLEDYLIEDERISLIKNKKNKGTFASRNLGILFSKGQYIIIPDPDDIISRNILKICYKYAEKYNYELIRFNTYKGNNVVNFNDTFIKKKLIHQPELSTYIFNEKDKFEIIDFWVSNKFIKKETYIRSLNSLNNNFIYSYIKNAEDVMMNFILHRVAKSLFKISNVGYYHIKNSQSLSNTLFPETKLKLKFSLILLKLIFDYSKNTKNEKDMSYNFYPIFKFLNIPNQISLFKKDFNFYKNFIKSFIMCKFISKENKRILYSFKNIIDLSFSINLTDNK